MVGDNRIFYPSPPIFPAQQSQAASTGSATKNNGGKAEGQSAFQQLLQQELSTLKFSSHALNRLQSRNIRLGAEDMQKLNDAVDKAAKKGGRESLIVLNNSLALVVSVKNRTVITALDSASMKENVFTNIDSAVIV